MSRLLRPQFKEKKTTQAALYLLKKRGGQMSYMKLIKLLYMADRESLRLWGHPITYDSYVSMNKGPVLSQTYALLIEGTPKEDNYWAKHISPPSNYEVGITKEEDEFDELSEIDRQTLDAVFALYGRLDRWSLVEKLHKELPEWKNPGNSSIPISLRELLLAVGKTEEETALIEDELEAIADAEAMLETEVMIEA